MHLTPDQIHRVDQNMAEAATTLSQTVDLFREHTARHDGDTVCAFAEILGMAHVEPRSAGWLLAAAVSQLAARTTAEQAL